MPESARYLSSKVRLTIPSKDAVFTVNGTMKLISGERMQLSFCWWTVWANAMCGLPVRN